MIWLETDRLPIGVEKWTLTDNIRRTIADRMLTICEPNWTDAFWLTKLFARQLDEHFNRRTTTLSIVEMKQQLAAVDHAVWQQFGVDDTWTMLPIELWLRTAGASVFNGKALEKLWDKICTGEGVISLCITVIVELLAAIGTDLLEAIALESARPVNIDELMRRILTPEMEAKIVLRAFDSMNRSGKFFSRSMKMK